MEVKSPPPCPNTVTIRRNPHRKARPTPSSTVPLPIPLSSSSSPSSIPDGIPSFPIQDILSMDVPQNPKSDPAASGQSSTTEISFSECLKVFLRIRPLVTPLRLGILPKSGAQPSRSKSTWPQNTSTKNPPKPKTKKKTEICITVNDSKSVTVYPPHNSQDLKRIKSEVYEGFSKVFSADVSQVEVYNTMVNPLVEDFIDGKSGMLAAFGPSGSGKTHTMFGSAREPGMVPLALRRIFSPKGGIASPTSRVYYLSMFEICSERGKAERMIDLSKEGGDLSMQQSTNIIKGLREVIIHDIQKAEMLIAYGMAKRATATTNSNNQSSRSQCIISIRSHPSNIEGEVNEHSNGSVLTIVDLAGAERERKTGNQGIRLLESNFINNTSMVLGLCLRSLLEHQKNPKKPLQKHFQSSLLTRYLREYLEGKKRMALILTVKQGEEDYLDTTFLLRQVSPFMKIKFKNLEETLGCNKRHIQTFPRAEQLKRMKFSSLETFEVSEKKNNGDRQIHKIGTAAAPDKTNEVNIDGKDQIFRDFSKALWNVLKDYKKKLEASENEINSLKESVTNEKARCSKLEDELNLKSSCSCGNRTSAEASLAEVDESRARISPGLEGYTETDVSEVNAVPYITLKEPLFFDSGHRSDSTVGGPNETFSSCHGVRNSAVQFYEKCEDTLDDVDDSEALIVERENQSNGTDTGTGHSEPSISSPLIEGDQVQNADEKNSPEPPIMTGESVADFQALNLSNVPEVEQKTLSSGKALSTEKPKRRLLPASSLLLRNVNGLNFEDDNEKPKEGREKKRDEEKRTQGSICLLRLLRSNLHL